jgi:cleavage and polyadenylation specificity factor subunit 1
MTLLPRPTKPHDTSLEPNGDSMELDSASEVTSQILLSDQAGTISVLTPLTPEEYRTLTALQSFLINTLPHPLGLNPRAHRHGEGEMGRAILDGGLLRRWVELGSWKRAESVARSGCESEWELRNLLDKVCGGGLMFL